MNSTQAAKFNLLVVDQEGQTLKEVHVGEEAEADDLASSFADHMFENKIDVGDICDIEYEMQQCRTTATKYPGNVSVALVSSRD